jgi:hypothetical protein
MMRFKKYLSSQALDEGFIPLEEPGIEIFYRTDDWNRYKVFKNHIGGKITKPQTQRYDRHAMEIIKLLKYSKNVLSLGGGTGSLERRLIKIDTSLNFTVSDIYDRDAVSGIKLLLLDMTDLASLRDSLVGFDTVLIANAISPLQPNELMDVVEAISESSVKIVIIYSAEDLRIFNGIASMIKNAKNCILKKKSMWIGYLYSSSYVTKIFKKYEFERSSFEFSREKGYLAQFWGSSYLAMFTKDSIDSPNDLIRIDHKKLLM